MGRRLCLSAFCFSEPNPGGSELRASGQPPRVAASLCAQHGGDERVKILEGAGRSDLERTARRRSRATGPAARPALKEAGSRNRESTNRKHLLQEVGCDGYEAA